MIKGHLIFKLYKWNILYFSKYNLYLKSMNRLLWSYLIINYEVYYKKYESIQFIFCYQKSYSRYEKYEHAEKYVRIYANWSMNDLKGSILYAWGFFRWEYFSSYFNRFI